MITTAQYLEKLALTRKDNAQSYDYSKSEYSGNDNKLTIVCKAHGEFEQRAGDHRRGSGCAKCGRIKAIDTNLEKYGTKNPASSDQIKNKIKAKFIEVYGVDNPSKDQAIKQKKEATCLKNYGVTNPNKSKVVRERTRNTNIKRYGVDVPSKNKEISAKIVATKIANGGFTKSNSSREATLYIRNYINENGYLTEQCAYADAESELHEWGIYHNGRWVLYDLVVFELGYRGNKSKVVEILEYHGPFHYTIDEASTDGNKKAYPWKTNLTTIAESVARDNEKELLGKLLTIKYTIIRTRN